MADSASPTVEPAEAPPSGFSPHFTHPWSIINAVKGLSGLMFALVALSTAVRVYTKIRILRDFDLTDCAYTPIIRIASLEVS